VEESSADRIAVDIVQKLGYSMNGFSNIMDKIQAEERLNASENQIGYLRTHPMTADRKQNISHFLKNTPSLQNDDSFNRIRAKLVAFMMDEKQALLQYNGTTNNDLYAQSIIDYRAHRFDKAFEKLDILISKEPENPYLYELKGQFKFETGKIDEAIQNYQKAYDLTNAPLIGIALAQAMLEKQDKDNAQRALHLLEKAVLKEGDSGLPWRLMATAYNRLNKPDLAQYAMAEYYYQTGKTKQAEKTAEKALKKLDKKSVAHQHLNDLLAQIKLDEKDD
jgi:predicted Zn-dependent protease